MKERLHDQITNELRQISRNDTTVITIALIVTFIFFGLAFGFAANAVDRNYGGTPVYGSTSVSIFASIIMFVSLFVIITINWFSIGTLGKNKAQKVKLAESLAKLYQEENLGQFIDNTSTSTLDTRRTIYTAILVIVSAAAIIIPLATYIVQIVENL
jgi:hypothetical protein